MLLERYVAEAITSHFGHVVEGLDPNKVRLSTWRGELEFHDLVLRRDALPTEFAEVLYGRIGTLHIKLPWQLLRRQLLWRSSPTEAGDDDALPTSTQKRSASSSSSQQQLKCRVVVSDVNILVVPKRSRKRSNDDGGSNGGSDSNSSVSSVAHGVDREAAIQAGLDAELLKRRFDGQQRRQAGQALNPAGDSPASSSSSAPTWRTALKQQLVNALLANLVVSVQNIHVRYEDPGTQFHFATTDNNTKIIGEHENDEPLLPLLLHSPFAVGFLLKQFSVQSPDREHALSPRDATDEHFDDASLVSGASHRRYRTQRKVLAAEDLAAYWDSDCQVMQANSDGGEPDSPDDYRRSFTDMNAAERSSHSFVLDPFSPKMELSLTEITPSTDHSANDPIASHAPEPPTAGPGRSDSQRIPSPPPSQVVVTLPPCRLTVTRNLLEDLGHLRHSYSAYQTSRKDWARQALHLTRPSSSPVEDPRAWWRFATQAVLIVQRSLEPKGWARLARAVSRQARYIALYRAVCRRLDVGDDSSADRRRDAHEALLHLEQNVLTVQEVVAFRVAVYRTMRRDVPLPGHSASSHAAGSNLSPRSLSSDTRSLHEGSVSSFSELEIDGSGLPIALGGESILSLDHRLRMADEFFRAMDQQSILDGADALGDILSGQRMNRRHASPLEIQLLSSLKCTELSLLVSDRHPLRPLKSRGTDVARLSCAVVVQYQRTGDGSWKVDTRIGSLKVKDCTATQDVARGKAAELFPDLVCNKPSIDQSSMELDGNQLYESLHVFVHRTSSSRPETGRVILTTVRVRVLPLEIVYSTAPVEALTRILAVADVDLIDDYRDLASRLYEWRERLRARLVRALAHKRKRIDVDVDIGAPVVLIPEDCYRNSPMLVVDLGRILFVNDKRDWDQKSFGFDDKWRLELNDLQVLCTSTYRYRKVTSNEPPPLARLDVQQLVEPFSLELMMSTKFENEGTGSVRRTAVRVCATLPRLALNCTSSAVRLLSRLQSQWEKRSLSHRLRRASRGRPRRLQAQPSPSLSERQVEFLFTAPVLHFLFDNDVDGRDCVPEATSSNSCTTPLLELTLKGIDGSVSSTRTASGDSRLSCEARLRALYSIDLYQKAGGDFMYLLSSVCPDFMIGDSPRDIGSLDSISQSDLVRFRYERRAAPAADESDQAGGTTKLSVKFNELYVEWNPETLSALFFAMAVPATTDGNMPAAPPGQSVDDSFYDAEEDEFFDAQSTFSASDDVHDSHSFHESTLQNKQGMPFEYEFTLSKLRVHFNKDSRHRRLLIVDMDRTFVHKVSRISGESITRAKIGNLTFADADHSQDKTLYREILGLKTDQLRELEDVSSLLEFELHSNPRLRAYVDDLEEVRERDDTTVEIDIARRKVSGYDTLVKATFSPMRFVYLQQLWFEIIDYFFEGIVGYEVWGNARPTLGSTHSAQLAAPHANNLPFTKFNITLSSPSILIPVSYCSTDYLRLDASTIAFANFHDFADMRVTHETVTPCLQWFNNCAVELCELRLFHCSGRELSGDAISAAMSLNWPVGPNAQLNSPKWNVRCRIDDMLLTLLQEDYSLIQHVIQRNLGEESRHLEEWVALQNLPPLVLQRYKEDIRVQFGYDKKDVPPTTFHVEVTLPIVSFRFAKSSISHVATVRCVDVVWNYRKLPDLVTRQTVTCDLEISDASDANSFLLSSKHRKSISDRLLSDLTYTSTTQPNGDNSRTVQLFELQVEVLYAAWREFGSFFASLPKPTFLSPKEVIQVGDRWYKIDSRKLKAPEVPRRGTAWLSGVRSSFQHQVASVEKAKHSTQTYHFQLLLVRPTIVLAAESSSISFLADEALFLHIGRPPLIERQFKICGLRLRATRLGRSESLNQSFITEPWFACGELRMCNGVLPCECPSHSVAVSADVLYANAAFSDLTIVAETGLHLLRQVREYQAKPLPKRASADEESPGDGPPTSSRPKESTISLRWDGLRVSIVDDSLRHFAVSQELVVLTLCALDFHREERGQGFAWNPNASTSERFNYLTRLRFASLDIVDSLQSTSSPFRSVLTVRSSFASVPEGLCPIEDNGEPQFAFELSSILSSSREYVAKIGTVEVQYNPSLVIALQRFLGRTSKDVRNRLAAVFDLPTDDSPQLASNAVSGRSESTTTMLDSEGTAALLVLGRFSFDYVRLCLNKEHQGRQLLEAVLSDGKIVTRQSRHVLQVSGHLGLLDALHNASDSVRNVLKVGGDSDMNFLDFHYTKFQERVKEPTSLLPYGLPDWVSSELQGKLEIDDCLSVRIASVDVAFEKALALEIVDYLSNGLPGRGMGLTSRVAKGFVQKRIQTKSFLEINVESPRILIPKGILSDEGVAISLGDLSVRSWVNQSRYLTLSLSGLSTALYGTRAYDDEESPICSNVDVKVNVEKSHELLRIRSSISSISVFLRNVEWVSLLDVYHLNLGRRLDKSQWDNLEFAWEQVNVLGQASPRYSRDVCYADNARIVRFGMPRSVPPTAMSAGREIDLIFECERLGLLLRRDDLSSSTREGSRGGQNVALFVLRNLAATLSQRSSGVQSASFSIGEIYVFNLGGVRRDTNSAEYVSSSPHSVLVEGYGSMIGHDTFDSQIVVTIDRSDTTSSEISASLLMNYISVTALASPIEDVVQFFTCQSESLSTQAPPSDEREPCPDTAMAPEVRSLSSPFTLVQVKLVLHYPRFVFILDENDKNSRALVLEGLAMVNASVHVDGNDACMRRTHADFLDVSSYINPDASTVTSFCQRHLKIAIELLQFSHPIDLSEDNDPLNGSSPRGIPLLSPFSLGFEYEQLMSTDSLKARTIGVSVDSLSMMVSLEDILLIRAILMKWSRRRSRVEARAFIYSVVFETERLGLGLRKDGSSVVVEHVNVIDGQTVIEGGDVLQMINGVALSDSSFASLSDVVDKLVSLPRPLTITFARSIRQTSSEAQDRNAVGMSSVKQEPSQFKGSNDTVDFSLSSAVVTFLNHDITLFRGTISKAETSCKLTRTDSNLARVNVSASIEIDYYNLRLWCWEPLLELCSVSISAELLDPHRGPKEVAIEVGDRSCGPMSFNLSDAAVETLAHVSMTEANESQIDILSDGLRLDPFDLEEPQGSLAPDRSATSEAANAALHFAQRQSSDSAKPFVFRNRTGVSVAFALEQEDFSSKAEGGNESSFIALGEYAGLQSYNSSQVIVVASNQDVNFKVEVLRKRQEGQGGRLFPSLTVSLQAVEGQLIAPLQGLDISNESEETPIPLSSASAESSQFNLNVQRNWLSWTVEQSDGRNVLTLATSLRIESLLSEIVEIGVELGDEGRNPSVVAMDVIGSCSSIDPIFLPIWLCLRKQRWRCSFRLSGCRWTTLFSVSDCGEVQLDQSGRAYVDCQPEEEGGACESLAIEIDNTESHLTLTLDCAVSMRNLLPASCNWEVNHAYPSPKFRRHFSGLLKSGDRAEIHSRGHENMELRIGLPPSSAWSKWTPLFTLESSELTDVPTSRKSTRIETQDPKSWTHNLKIVDPFGVPLFLGIRVARKRRGGLVIMLYADLWISNCSSLPLAFGYTREPATAFNKPSGFDPSASDVSAAEAALREISSLFEFGEEGKKLTRREVSASQLFVVDIYQLPFQRSTAVVEECFEYIELDASAVVRRWWASENPHALRENLTVVASDGEWQWIDKAWSVDSTGRTASGWESSTTLDSFSEQREFNPEQRFRRRRWVRSRTPDGCRFVDKVNGFFEPLYSIAEKTQGKEKTISSSCFRVALKVGGGKWAMTSMIPKHGTSHGALRALRARWPRVQAPLTHTHVYELCYAVSPLDGIWGEFSRVLLVTDRFLLRNDSRSVTVAVKQYGSDDRSSVSIGPGEKTPFHWSSFNLPELISVRPIPNDEYLTYEWSGGFDPLSIGAIPLRIRVRDIHVSTRREECSTLESVIRSIQVEPEIRARTGGTGINITFQDEDPTGVGALFRIENHSMFSIWFSQDGLLANRGSESGAEGDLVKPSESVVFALDVPFRQGKYQGRNAATTAELLRVRLGLAPLLSQAGVETTKVIDFATSGERVRLNPSKLTFLESRTRKSLSRVRVLGIVVNDGPTRVLRFSVMMKANPESIFSNPFNDERSSLSDSSRHFEQHSQEIIDAAVEASNLAVSGQLPTEDESIERAIFDVSRIYTEGTHATEESSGSRDFLVSFRAAFQGLIVSAIDNAPSEICVVSLKNLNVLASWNTQRTTTSTMYMTVANVQVDNMIPNAPFPVAVCPHDASPTGKQSTVASGDGAPPMLVVGVSFAPRHSSGVVCLRSVTVAPRNLSVSIDLAFLVRLQKYLLELQAHFQEPSFPEATSDWPAPDVSELYKSLEEANASPEGRQKYFFGGLTIMPCNIKLSVAPARALTSAQAALEGEIAAAIHQAVRKGDVKLGDSKVALLGVRVGHTNSTPLAVVRGVFKSIVVDALLRLDGAKLNFAGVSLRNHTSTTSQLSTHLGVHYFASLRQNLPALLGSLSAFGNPLGLVRGLGDGVSDFVLEPVRGFQRSVQEMDATHLVDGVARGTLSLARHTVGGFADSAALLTETFSKNMTVLTLDRRYAQKRDRKEMLREQQMDGTSVNVATGIGSGVQKLAQGFIEGVTGVVKAPLRGAEKKGFEGFAKGIGKGLLGLLVKPIIGISDGLTDFMIGVKGTVEGPQGYGQLVVHQVRPRRALYGSDRRLRPYNVADAAASALMLRTRLAGEPYLSHMDMGNRVALLSVTRLLLLGARGDELAELLVLKFKHIDRLEVRAIEQEDGSTGHAIIVILNTRRRNGSEVEVINCKDKAEADELSKLIEQGMSLADGSTGPDPL